VEVYLTKCSRFIFNNQLQLAYIVGVDDGDLTMRDNCFIGNDDHIVPVIVENSLVDVRDSFVQRQSDIPTPTQCQFLSVTLLERNYSCAPSDAHACSASSLSKVLDEIPCLNSLDGIDKIESEIENDQWTRTYILCANTTFTVGSTGDISGPRKASSGPIVIGRPNIRIICGPDAKSRNGCVVSGGKLQLAIQDVFQTGRPATNGYVRGLTFTGASSVNVLAVYPSDVEFRDCIFRVSELCGGKSYLCKVATL
jgi:hypothetical protein